MGPTSRAQVAHETRGLLPGLLATMPKASPLGTLYTSENLPPLDPKNCPGFTSPDPSNPKQSIPGTPIQIISGDTVDTSVAESAIPASRPDIANTRVCMLNMANAHTEGGSWLRGSRAQEEQLCYRTSLSVTLKRDFYPIPDVGGVYSPNVVVMREAENKNFAVMDFGKPDALPVVSAVSVPAVSRPPTKIGKAVDGTAMDKYSRPADRTMMKDKMRVMLRIAATNGHTRIVLGAFGCGSFANPRAEVALCFREVLEEGEFQGGWWERIAFAIIDDNHTGKTGTGNLGVFTQGLDGLVV